MAFLDKLGDIARNLGDKTTDAIETTKLNSKIGSEKTAIAECMRKIGEYYYQKRNSGEFSDDGAAELFAAIDGHNQAIADAQAEIERIKTETARTAGTVPAPSAGGEVACLSCGKSNISGTKFCCECGAKLEIPAPAAPEARPCPGCGAQIPAANKFCGDCGYKFD
jgi:hypothetical protein